MSATLPILVVSLLFGLVAGALAFKVWAKDRLILIWRDSP